MALSSGVYSLLGVFVGGGVTWATQWRLAARSDRLDTRVARRKIRAEIRQHRQATVHAATVQVRSHDDLDRLGDELQQPSEAWTRHSDRLARQLGDPDWDAVERAYEVGARLISIVRDDRVPPSDEEFEQARKAIDDALDRLR